MKIVVVGCGGIGSYFIEFLHKAKLSGQLGLLTNIEIYDFDTVELKNITYQNFTMNDAGKNKAEILGIRYGLDYINCKITDGEELNTQPDDIVICCIDNNKTRIELFKHMRGYGKFLDIRSKGKIVTILTDKIVSDEYLKLTENDDGLSSSCQNDFELSDNKVQYGNLIASTIGMQILVDMVRNEPYTDKFIQVF